MENIVCEHSWVDKGVYKECLLCGAIQIKRTVQTSGIICDDAEKGNYRFCQSEDEEEQSDNLPRNDKHD